MTELIKSILDKFTHLLRDLLFYFVSGFLVILYIVYLSSYFETVFNSTIYIIIVVICSFVLGHVLMVTSRIVFEDICKCSNSCDKNFNLNDKNIMSYIYLKKEIEIYNKTLSTKNSTELFNQYIERYNTLYFFRKNLTLAFIFISLISTIYLFSIFFINYENLLCIHFQGLYLYSTLQEKYFIAILMQIFSVIFSVTLYFGTKKTKQGMDQRIKIIHKILFPKKNE